MNSVFEILPLDVIFYRAKLLVISYKNDNIAKYFEELRHQIPLPVKADIYSYL